CVAPLSTFPAFFSNAYSGLCTPTTSRPRSLYLSYQSTTCGMARWQLMHEYAQKSIRTILPRSDFRSTGASPGVLSQLAIPLISGAAPQLSSCLAPLLQFD